MPARVQERARRLDEDYPSTRCTALRCRSLVCVVVARIRSFNNSWRAMISYPERVGGVTALSGTEMLIVSSVSSGAIHSAPARRVKKEMSRKKVNFIRLCARRFKNAICRFINQRQCTYRDAV